MHCRRIAKITSLWDAQDLLLGNAKSKVEIHDECGLWTVSLADLLLKHSLQLPWDLLRTLLPIVVRFAGRNTRLVFISPSTLLLVHLSDLYV